MDDDAEISPALACSLALGASAGCGEEDVMTRMIRRNIRAGILMPVHALCLAACIPGSGPQLERDGPLQQIPTAADVAGQWDVVSFAGYRPSRLSGTGRAAYADFGTEGVSLRMECNYTGRSGRIVDGHFTSNGASDHVQTEMGCGSERGPREERYFRFFGSNPSIEMVSTERLRLSAGPDELILERPSLRRLSYLVSNADLQGEWEMLELSWFPPSGGVAGIGLSEVPNRVVINGDRLVIQGCPGIDLTFHYTERGQLRNNGGTPLPAGPLACLGLSDTPDAPALPRASDSIRLLHANPLVERAEEGTLSLSTDTHALLIRRVLP